MSDIIGYILIIVGILFDIFGCIGLVRFPDVYNRLQAGTKCTTLGAFLTIVGVGIMNPDWFWRTLAIALFILVTNPISNHALGRASRKIGVPLCDKSVVDETEGFEEYKEK